MTLYELEGNYRYLLELMENDEVSIEAVLNTIEIVEDDIVEKLDGYGRVIKSVEANEAGIDKEIERLQAKKQSQTNKIKAMKKRIGEVMVMMDKKKVKTPLFSFNVQKNAPSLDIEEGSEIPKDFYIDQEPKLDRKALLAAVKDGAAFKGVQLKQTESLRIR